MRRFAGGLRRPAFRHGAGAVGDGVDAVDARRRKSLTGLAVLRHWEHGGKKTHMDRDGVPMRKRGKGLHHEHSIRFRLR